MTEMAPIPMYDRYDILVVKSICHFVCLSGSDRVQNISSSNTIGRDERITMQCIRVAVERAVQIFVGWLRSPATGVGPADERSCFSESTQLSGTSNVRPRSFHLAKCQLQWVEAKTREYDELKARQLIGSTTIVGLGAIHI